MQASLEAAIKRPIILVECDFLDSTVRLASTPFAVNWNGNLWLGAATVGTITPAAEAGVIQAPSFTLALSGIPSDLVQEALGQCGPNQPVKIWFGALTDAGEVIADPTMMFGGLMDVPTIKPGAATSTISITVETRAARFKSPRVRRYTDDDQQSMYPGDRGFAGVNGTLSPFTWGGSPAAGSAAGGGYGGSYGSTTPGGTFDRNVA